MTRPIWFLIPLATAFTASRADASPKHYADARAAWAACFPANAPVEFPEAPSGDDPGQTIDVTVNGTHFRIASSWGGSGVDAVYGGITIDFDSQTCGTLWEHDDTYDGAFALKARIGWTKRAAPNDREIAALGVGTTATSGAAAAPAVAAAPAAAEAPERAMARTWLEQSCDGGQDSTLAWSAGKLAAGPVSPAQPWLRGEPTKSATSFWSRDQLHAIGARASLDVADDDDMLPRLAGDAIAGVIVPGLDAPKKTFKVGTTEIREVDLPGRNAGRAIALYDRAANRHRWVLLTRGCVQGSTVQWLGAIGTRAIGVTTSRHGNYAHGDAIVVVDTAEGTAWAVKFPDAVANGDIDRTRAKLTGATINFGSGAKTDSIDLAPAIAELPTK